MAKKKRDGMFWDSAEQNNKTFRYYFDRLTELAISMFDWRGLPASVDARFLELSLYRNGQAVYFNDEVMGNLALMVAASGELNVYGIPTSRRAYSMNGYQQELNDENSVLIFNNMLHTAALPVIEFFAEKLWRIDRTIDVNVNAQKTPVAVLAGEKQRLTMLNMYKQYDGNQPFIFGDAELDLNKIKAITTNAPYVAGNLMQLKFQIWNEAMTYLGISNVNMHKKERLLNDEVTRNMGSTVASRHSRLNERQTAAEKINKMFGTDISVDYREDVQMLVDETKADLGIEGGEGDE